MRTGGKAIEIVGLGIWALAAGNVLVYTVRSFQETFKSPPLSVWQGKTTEKGSKTSPESKKVPKKKGGSENPLEKINPLNPENYNPLVPAEELVGGAKALGGAIKGLLE